MNWNPEGWQPDGWQPDGWQPGEQAVTVPVFNGPAISDFTLQVDAAMTPRDFSARFASALPLTFTLQGGAITGLALSSAGVLSGTPTVPGVYTGRFIRAADGSNPDADSNLFTISVVESDVSVGVGDGALSDGAISDGSLSGGGLSA